MNQPLTPEQTKSAYQRVCEQECELCRNGRALIPEGEPYAGWHIVDAPHSYRSPCTAPSKDAFMERQAAQIAAIQAALAIIAKRTCGSDCKNRHVNDNKDLPKIPRTSWCAKCLVDSLSDDVERGKELLGAEKRAEYWQKRLEERARQAQEAGVSFWTGKDGEGCTNDRAEKAERERDQCADSYIRQQERLTAERDGALQASRYNADVATQAVEEMKRQAVEIEELRKDKARLDWREANPCHGFGKYSDGTWADGKGGSHRTYRDAVSAAMKEKP